MDQNKIHTINHPVYGDKLQFVDYGQHGMTVRLNYSGEWFDFGFAPDEVANLIEWLSSRQEG